MSTLSELLAEHTDLPGTAVDHLQRVVGDWQLLADLSFADLLLWVGAGKVGDGAPVVCVAQCRPTTATTVNPKDFVGTSASEAEHPQVIRALRLGETVLADAPGATQSIREAIPVRHGTEVI